MEKVRHFLSDHANLWMVGAFAIAAYLSLFNLGGQPLWHDEATSAYMGENLWRNGTLSGWNGHTLYVGENGTAVNSDLIMASFPPWPAFPSALGIAIFGANEFGARIFHTLLGLASLLIFWQLLRMDFAMRPRLRVLAFVLFALSTQVILFMRVGKYVQDAFFFTFLSFYAYRLYTAPGGRAWHLALAAAATVLGFLNHFAIGAAFALSLGIWHLIYHFHHTSRRQWVEIGIAAAVTGGLCFAYLVGMGIIFSDEVLEFSEREYRLPLLERKTILVAQNFRELVWFGILPLWVALWFLWYIGAHLHKIYKNWQRYRTPGRDAGTDSLMRWTVLMILFLVISGLFSVRPPSTHNLADTRYMSPVLAFTALIAAAMIDWLWRQPWAEKIVALPVLAILLCTNLLSYPVIFPQLFTKEKVRLTLPSLVAEVHTAPYRNYLREALDYLDEHAREGDAVFVSPWQELTLLQFYYLGDKFVFCCALDENTTVPKDKVRALGIPIFQQDVTPEWVLTAAPLPEGTPFQLVYTSETYPYPTNRPELEFHTFKPLVVPGAHYLIYRKRS